VGADRPPTATHDQAETAQAEAAAAPLIAALDAALADVRAPLAALAGTGREVAGRLQALDVDGMRQSIGTGGLQLPDLSAALDRLAKARDEAAAGVDRGRVGSATSERLAKLLAAADAAEAMLGNWQALAARALLVGTLVDALNDHDAAVFAATEFGRAARWDEALARLDQAGGYLADAATVRNQLTPTTATPTLDNLLVRYAAYNTALADLYADMRDVGNRTSVAFALLQESVTRSQAALPTRVSILNVVVDEAAGSALNSNLAAMESAISDMDEASR
jgi:hypothetical protein